MKIILKSIVATVTVSAISALMPSMAGSDIGIPRNLFLEEGKRQLRMERFSVAMEEFELAINIPDVPIIQQKEILFWMGVALHLQGNIQAEEKWVSFIQIDSDPVPPDGLPEEIYEAYEEVKNRTVFIRHEVPKTGYAGHRLVIYADLHDNLFRTSDLLLYSRRAGESGFQSHKFEAINDDLLAEIFLPELDGSATGYIWEYYIMAQAQTGEILHSFGDRDSPLELKVQASSAPEEIKPLIKPEVIVEQKAFTSPVPPEISEVSEMEPAQRRRGVGGLLVWGTIIGVGILFSGAGAYYYLGREQGPMMPYTNLGTEKFPLGAGEL